MSDNILSLFAMHAKSKPDCLAFQQILENGSVQAISYGELYRKATNVAAALIRQGFRGERALICLPLGIEFVTAFMGCALANVTAIPVPKPRLGRTDEIFLSIVNDSESKVIICQTEAKSAAIEEAIKGRGNGNVRLFTINCIPEIDDDPCAIPSTISLDDLLYIQYTSGSTGLPKGVMIDHGNLVANCYAIAEAFSFADKEIFVTWLPPNHDMGLVGGLIMPIWLGARGILLNSTQVMKRPRLWLETISRYRATASGAPNFAFELCNQKLVNSELHDLDLSSWRVACVGAEPVNAATLERFSSIFARASFNSRALRPSYGLAEATVMVSGRLSKIQGHLPLSERNHVACGSPLVNCNVEIVDPITHIRCPPGKVGEIWLSAPSVSRGYWGKPLESDLTFRNALALSSERKFLRTGDLGFLIETGLFVTGRLKDIIIIRGINYSPSLLENTVRETSPELRNCLMAAFSFLDDDQEKVAIVCECPPRWKKIDPTLIKDIRGELSRRNQVKMDTILFVKFGTMPVTTSGKVQRNACRAMFLQDRLSIVGHWTDSFDSIGGESNLFDKTVSALLLNEVAQVVHADPTELTPETLISDLGLDSMAAIKIAHLIEEKFGVVLSIDIFLGRTSISEIASYIVDAQSSAKPASKGANEDFDSVLDTLTDDEIKAVLFVPN